MAEDESFWIQTGTLNFFFSFLETLCPYYKLLLFEKMEYCHLLPQGHQFCMMSPWELQAESSRKATQPAQRTWQSTLPVCSREVRSVPVVFSGNRSACFSFSGQNYPSMLCCSPGLQVGSVVPFSPTFYNFIAAMTQLIYCVHRAVITWTSDSKLNHSDSDSDPEAQCWGFRAGAPYQKNQNPGKRAFGWLMSGLPQCPPLSRICLPMGDCHLKV